MTTCAVCQLGIDLEGGFGIRSGDQAFHIGCAPEALLMEACDEYEAIVRKGVRYFVEKYSVGAADPKNAAPRFMQLGAILEAERQRRTRL
jgi:hypothetical protein